MNRLLYYIVPVLVATCCTAQEKASAGREESMHITSTAFKEGEPIPAKYTCDGADVSPPLTWGGIPEGTQSLALISDDPDAPRGTWVHWIVYNIPPDTAGFSEGENLAAKGITEGLTDFRQASYGGPCPPSGTHRYYFKLYALDTTLALGPRATKPQVESAMEGHILGQAQLMGRYARQR